MPLARFHSDLLSINAALRLLCALVLALFVANACISIAWASTTNRLELVWPVSEAPERRGLERIVEQQQLRILTPIQAGWYQIEEGVASGSLVGWAAELENYLAEKLALSPQQFRVTVVPVPAERLSQHLLRGYGELALSPQQLPVDASITYSDPLNIGFAPVWLSGPAQSAPYTWTNLAGKSVMVLAGSSTHKVLIERNQALLVRGYESATIMPVDANTPIAELIAMVRSGKAPALVIDGGILWGESLAGVAVEAELELAPLRRLQVAVRKRDQSLLAEINQFVQQQHNLDARPRTTKPLIKNVAEAKPSAQMRELFKAAGVQHNIDWRLLEAFAYQQSWFNQQARSHQGGIGVMQITTAMASEVGVENIDDLAKNIDAGARYLAKVNAALFADAPQNSVEGYLIAMAAYEAGVSRIERLQQLAQQRGFNPNRWHGHLEHIVLAEVGGAAVGSIDSIYRYYLGLTLADS